MTSGTERNTLCKYGECTANRDGYWGMKGGTEALEFRPRIGAIPGGKTVKTM
jgi:hypothetical protein